MLATFATLPEAQAYARANGLVRYIRLNVRRVGDSKFRHVQQQHMNSFSVFYMDMDSALDRARGIVSSSERIRVEIETLYTDEVSDSPNAR